jgi:hypothetical protein
MDATPYSLPNPSKARSVIARGRRIAADCSVNASASYRYSWPQLNHRVHPVPALTRVEGASPQISMTVENTFGGSSEASSA